MGLCPTGHHSKDDSLLSPTCEEICYVSVNRKEIQQSKEVEQR